MPQHYLKYWRYCIHTGHVTASEDKSILTITDSRSLKLSAKHAYELLPIVTLDLNDQDLK